MLVQPYLFLNGRCEEAIKFYQGAVGAKVNMMMRFGDAPPPPQGGGDPGCAGGSPPPSDKVMHADVSIGDSHVLFSDGDAKGNASFQGFALSLTVATLPDAEKAFAALSKGGRVNVPLGPTFFSPGFGMLLDQFGVMWMVYVAPKQ